MFQLFSKRRAGSAVGRRLRGVVLGGVLAGLSACTAGLPTQRAGVSNLVPESAALAFPPPGGPEVVGVVERRYSGAVQQDIALATDAAVPGQNMLRLNVLGPFRLRSGTGRDETAIAAEDIAAEMRRELPGVPMHNSPYYVQNAYGPFGYAVGRAGARDLCLYGWQRIGAPGGTRRFFSGRGSIDVRLRLCEAGATEEALLSTMYGYTVNAPVANPFWVPFGVAPASAALGRAGTPIYPQGQVAMATVLDEPPPPAAAPRRAARRPAPPPAAEAAAQPAPSGPRVPPPVAGTAAGPGAPPPPPVEAGLPLVPLPVAPEGAPAAPGEASSPPVSPTAIMQALSHLPRPLEPVSEVEE